MKSNIIKLIEGHKCKCPCNIYKGSDNKNYWYNSREKIIYSTDCHKPNPKVAIGNFSINNSLIKQI